MEESQLDIHLFFFSLFLVFWLGILFDVHMKSIILVLRINGSNVKNRKYQDIQERKMASKGSDTWCKPYSLMHPLMVISASTI